MQQSIELLNKVVSAIAIQEGYNIESSLSYINRNPGNLKMGRFARLFGATKMDKHHHAIFPTAELGHLALRVLLATKFKGKTIREIGTVWAEDPRWALSIAAIANLDIDTIPFPRKGEADAR